MAANRRNKSGGMRGIFVILAALAVVCLAVEGAYCRTITVRADGSGDYPTIQVAIDAAFDGDEVVLEPGTYTGDGNRDIDFLGKAITVRGIEPNYPNVAEEGGCQFPKSSYTFQRCYCAVNVCILRKGV